MLLGMMTGEVDLRLGVCHSDHERGSFAVPLVRMTI
jgi:hypothetical protein